MARLAWLASVDWAVGQVGCLLAPRVLETMIRSSSFSQRLGPERSRPRGPLQTECSDQCRHRTQRRAVANACPGFGGSPGVGVPRHPRVIGPNSGRGAPSIDMLCVRGMGSGTVSSLPAPPLGDAGGVNDIGPRSPFSCGNFLLTELGLNTGPMSLARLNDYSWINADCACLDLHRIRSHPA